MSLFNFLFSGGAGIPSAFAPTNLVPPAMYSQQQPPQNRRDAAMIANDLPNYGSGGFQPPQAPQQQAGPQVPAQMPPQAPQPQEELPNGLFRTNSPYEAMLPAIEDADPGFFGRILRTGDLAEGIDGTAFRQRRMDERLNLIQKLQQIDKGGRQELGSGTGITYDINKGPDETAWRNVEKLKALESKYSRSTQGGGGAEYVDTVVDPQTGQTYRSYMTSGANGPTVSVRGLDNKAPPPEVAARLIPASIMNTQVKGDVNFTNKQVEEIVTQADAASKSNLALQSMRQTFQGAAAQGFGGDAQRWFMENLGMDIGTLNVADKQTFEAATRQLEGQLTKQILGGQGQITEGERKIVREMLPTLRTNPKAFDRIMSIYEGANQRALSVDRAWFNYKDRLGSEADYSTFKRVLNATKGRGDAEAYQLLEQWTEEGNLNTMPDWVMAKPSKNAPKGTDGPLEVPAAGPPAAPPPGPPTGIAPGPNGQRYKWSREAPTSSIIKGTNPAAFQNSLPQPAPAPAPQPQSFRPGMQTGGVGGPEGMGPPPMENTFAPRFEGDTDLGVYTGAPSPQGPARPSSLLNTPRDRLIAASRATQRGQQFNRQAGEAKEIARLLKQLPRMSPTDRAKTEAYLKSLGLIQ
jgi:hypothetical protein